MTKQECKKIEFYLYNYNRINLLIKEREMQIIDSINVSSRSWIKSLKRHRKYNRRSSNKINRRYLI